MLVAEGTVPSGVMSETEYVTYSDIRYPLVHVPLRKLTLSEARAQLMQDEAQVRMYFTNPELQARCLRRLRNIMRRDY